MARERATGCSEGFQLRISLIYPRIKRTGQECHVRWRRFGDGNLELKSRFLPCKNSASLSKRTSPGRPADGRRWSGLGEQRNEQRQSLTITSIEYQIVFAAPPPCVLRPFVRSEGRSWVGERRRLNLWLFKAQTLLYPSYSRPVAVIRAREGAG